MAVIQAFSGGAESKEEIASDRMGGAAQDQLKAFVGRIERLEEDKANVMADLKQVYDEAKAMGYDVKVLRKVIRLRKMDRNERDEQEALLDLYLSAIGDA